jgi:hypothetical protein
MEIADGEKIFVDGNPRGSLQNGFQIIEPEGAECILKDIFPDAGFGRRDRLVFWGRSEEGFS